jgi:hypothetical protein
MPAIYRRIRRTVHLKGPVARYFEVRSYVAAATSSEARTQTRFDALKLFDPIGCPLIVGFEWVEDVPGVTSPRPPEIRVAGRWLKVFV